MTRLHLSGPPTCFSAPAPGHTRPGASNSWAFLLHTFLPLVQSTRRIGQDGSRSQRRRYASLSSTWIDTVHEPHVLHQSMSSVILFSMHFRPFHSAKTGWQYSSLGGRQQMGPPTRRGLGIPSQKLGQMGRHAQLWTVLGMSEFVDLLCWLKQVDLSISVAIFSCNGLAPNCPRNSLPRGVLRPEK